MQKQKLADLLRVKIVCGIKLQDGLLHAIKEEYVEAVEVLLEWEEQNHKPGERYVNINLQFTHAPPSNLKGRKYKQNTPVLCVGRAGRLWTGASRRSPRTSLR
jgi:hypothetical protein